MNLPVDYVHLWYAFPGSIPEESVAEQVHILSPEERRQWDAFHLDADRHHFLVAHLLLRHALCRYVNCLPQHLRFARGAFGKPSLAGPQSCLPLEFNLTHANGLVACVVARHPVGIDAEWLGRKIDLGIASSVLATQELNELFRWPSNQRHSRLLEYWTLKEAFVKATGRGLSQPLDRFWFRLERTGVPTIGFAAGESSQEEMWQFVQHNELSLEHLLAVAVKLPGPAMLNVETQPCWLPSPSTSIGFGG